LIKINLRFFFSLICILLSQNSDRCVYVIFRFFSLIQSKDTVTDKRINLMNASSISSKGNDDVKEKKKKGKMFDIECLFKTRTYIYFVYFILCHSYLLDIFPRIKWMTLLTSLMLIVLLEKKIILTGTLIGFSFVILLRRKME